MMLPRGRFSAGKKPRFEYTYLNRIDRFVNSTAAASPLPLAGPAESATSQLSNCQVQSSKIRLVVLILYSQGNEGLSV